MFKRLIKALDNLADAIDSLVEKLDTVVRVMNTVGTSYHVERIVGSDPAVQKALGIQGKKRVAVRHTKERWTFEENRFVNECIRAGMSPSTIQRGLHDLGYDRTLSAVKHKVHDYKSATKPIKM